METNKEHYAKEIIEVVLDGGTPMVTIKGEIKDCGGDGLGKCEECIFRDIPCYNVKYLQKLRKWANAEYHDPIPKLTELEIEELNYFSHHGAVEMNNSFNVGYTYKRWGIYCIDKGKLVFDRFIECDYKSLDPRKTYNIKDLLEGQNVK